MQGAFLDNREPRDTSGRFHCFCCKTISQLLKLRTQEFFGSFFSKSSGKRVICSVIWLVNYFFFIPFVNFLCDCSFTFDKLLRQPVWCDAHSPPIDEGERVSKERIWYVMLVKVICIHRLAYYGRRQKLSLLFCLSLPATPHFAYIHYIHMFKKLFEILWWTFFLMSMSTEVLSRYMLCHCNCPLSQDAVRVGVTSSNRLFVWMQKKPKESSQERPRFF